MVNLGNKQDQKIRFPNQIHEPCFFFSSIVHEQYDSKQIIRVVNCFLLLAKTIIIPKVNMLNWRGGDSMHEFFNCFRVYIATSGETHHDQDIK